MNKPIITAQKLAEMYPTSHKIASEKMTPEEYANFTDEAAEINARLEAQEAGNVKLKEDVAAANTAKTAAENQVTILKADGIKQQAEIDRLKPFENKVLEIQEKGKGSPNEDNNSRDEGKKLPENHPNVVAFNAWKAANPNAK